MPRHTTISRSVLSDQVKDRLLQAILAGKYPPGSRIVETRAAREFGTSQAPVREALRDLEAIGVVEIHAFRGARVRRPTRSELLEAFGVRAELESLGARLALPRITDVDLDELQGHVTEMQRAAHAGDRHAEARADASFHGRIVAIAGNRTLERVWGYLEPYSRTYITLIVPGANAGWIADLHVPILDALRCRDAAKVEEVLRHHFDEAASMLGGLWLEPSTGVGERRPAGPPTAASSGAKAQAETTIGPRPGRPKAPRRRRIARPITTDGRMAPQARRS